MTTKATAGRAGNRFRGAAAAAVAVASCLSLPAAALDPTVTVSAPVRVSGSVPLAADCPSSGGNGPHAAVDPLHPNHVAVVYSVGGVVADVVASSTDGGASWSRQVLPGLTSCSGGDDGVPGDPMVAVGAGGATLTTAGWVTNDQSTGVDNQQGDNLRLLLNRSDKIGQPFAGAVEPDPRGPDQRGPISFAPGSNSDVLVAFERVHYVNQPQFDSTGGFIPGTGGSIWVAHSSSGGRRWDPPQQVVGGQPGSDVLTVGLVRSGSAVVLIYVVADTTTLPGSVAAGQGLREQLFSTTQLPGSTAWSPPAAIGAYYYPHARPQGCCIPDVSVGADGTMYAAWPHFDDANPTAPRYDAIDIASSRDAGHSWSSAVVTGGELGLGTGDVYEPAVAAGGHGSLGLLYYEVDAAKNLMPRIALSADSGETWTSQALAGAFPTTDVQAGNQDGETSVGPYQDLVAQPDGYGALVTIGAGSAEDVWWFGVKTRD